MSGPPPRHEREGKSGRGGRGARRVCLPLFFALYYPKAGTAYLIVPMLIRFSTPTNPPFPPPPQRHCGKLIPISHVFIAIVGFSTSRLFSFCYPMGFGSPALFQKIRLPDQNHKFDHFMEKKYGA